MIPEFLIPWWTFLVFPIIQGIVANQFVTAGLKQMDRANEFFGYVEACRARCATLQDNLREFVEEVDVWVEPPLFNGGLIVGFSPKYKWHALDNVDAIRRIYDESYVWCYHQDAIGESYIERHPGYFPDSTRDFFLWVRRDRTARARVMQSSVAEGTPLPLADGAL